MCIFQYRAVRWDREIPKSEAITAYKAMRIEPDGTFRSPIFYASPAWKNREMRQEEIHGANESEFKRKYYSYTSTGFTATGDGPKWNPGIHCMTSKRAAREHGYVIVRVSMWGRVIAYKSDPWLNRFKGAPGYLCQNARIEAIVDAYDWESEKAFKRYSTLLDERK